MTSQGHEAYLDLRVDHDGTPLLVVRPTDGEEVIARAADTIVGRRSVSTATSGTPDAPQLFDPGYPQTMCTLTVGSGHPFRAADIVRVRGLGAPYDGRHTLMHATDTTVVFIVDNPATAPTTAGARSLPGTTDDTLDCRLTPGWSGTSWSFAGWVRKASGANHQGGSVFSGRPIGEGRALARWPKLEIADVATQPCTLTFKYACRDAYGSSPPHDFAILIDGQSVATVTSSSTSYTDGSLALNLTAGPHTVAFQGINSGGADATSLIDSVVLSADADPGTNLLSDAGFETPVVGVGKFAYTPTAPPWTFTGGAGIGSNGSGFTQSNPNAPDGVQVAFLQGGVATFSQPFTVAAVAPVYRLGDLAGGSTASFGAATDDTWVHLAAVRSGDTVTLYRNGTAGRLARPLGRSDPAGPVRRPRLRRVLRRRPRRLGRLALAVPDGR